MLRLRQSVEQEIFGQARLRYPEECCGVLLRDAALNVVAEAVGCPNVAAERDLRYRIDPAELIRIQREARARGLEIAGFYHSHPDQPAQPSASDLAEAYWTGCWYVIVSVRDQEVSPLRAYRLVSAGQIVEEPVEVIAPAERLL